MSPTTPTAPLDSSAMWRRLLAVTHPDRGGNHEVFVWATALREYVTETLALPAPEPGTTQTSGQPERIPFDEALGYADDFVDLTCRALSIGKRAGGPFRGVLGLLIDCDAVNHGRRAARQMRGASYRQLACIAHTVGISKAERTKWYDIAENIPLSDAHANHIIGKLKKKAA